MSCVDCSDTCTCTIIGDSPIIVTGVGSVADPYVVSYELPCEDAQDCIGAMLDDQGFVYNDALDRFDNPGSLGQFLASDGAGNAEFTSIPSVDCETVQDCIGGMLTTQGFVYDDVDNRFENTALPGTVLTSNGGGGASFIAPLTLDIDNDWIDGRLTLVSGTPVTTTDVTGTTVYYTPYRGNRISIYNGAAWATYNFSELSISFTSSPVGVFDIFIWDDTSGGPSVLKLEKLAWTNPTTRATAIVRQDGVWVKSGAPTRRYLGTVYVYTTSTIADNKEQRFVWNVANRVRRKMSANQSGNWTISSLFPIFSSVNGNALNRLQFVLGISEDSVMCGTAALNSSGTVPTNMTSATGMGLDSAVSAQTWGLGMLGTNTLGLGGYGGLISHWNGYPAAGFHYLQQLECVVGGPSLTGVGSYTFIYGEVSA